jgi:hypothetical protein
MNDRWPSDKYFNPSPPPLQTKIYYFLRTIMRLGLTGNAWDGYINTNMLSLQCKILVDNLYKKG